MCRGTKKCKAVAGIGADRIYGSADSVVGDGAAGCQPCRAPGFSAAAAEDAIGGGPDDDSQQEPPTASKSPPAYADDGGSSTIGEGVAMLAPGLTPSWGFDA
jgi:hypothetical protein